MTTFRLNSFDTSEGNEIPAESWNCPFCKRAVSAKIIEHIQSFQFLDNSGGLRVRIRFMECPNSQCREVTVQARLDSYRTPQPVPDLREPGKHLIPDPKVRHTDLPMDTWIRPTVPGIKVFPECIPEPIRRDYEEAYLIRTLSPKASATLSRRCLEGMIRDFYKVRKRNLKLAIEAIRNKVTPKVWQAIDSVRQIGNIGAHMERDINLVIDVEPREALLLIELNEMLFQSWYIAREDESQKLQAVIDLAKDKLAAKKSGQLQTPPNRAGADA